MMTENGLVFWHHYAERVDSVLSLNTWKASAGKPGVPRNGNYARLGPAKCLRSIFG